MFGLRLTAVLVFVSLMLGGCPTTQQGIGGPTLSSSNAPAKSTSDENENITEALDIDYRRAVNVAEDVARRVFDTGIVTKALYNIRVDYSQMFMGDVSALIEPKVVRGRKSSKVGIIYEIKSAGYGRNASMLPGYVGAMFFEGLANYRQENRIRSIRISDPEILRDRGVTEKVAKSVPVDLDKFIKFLDGKVTRLFEGVWSDHDGGYTLLAAPVLGWLAG